MPFKESTQHILDRVRPPRVQITYDVEIGDAVEQKELPLVVGILADLAGQRQGLARLKDRKFVEIDRDSFDKVMAAIGPRLKLSVENKLRADGGRMSVELELKSIDAFHPRQLVEQIEPLRELMESRQRLMDLMAKLDGNDELADLLRSLLADRARLQAIQAELKAGREH